MAGLTERQAIVKHFSEKEKAYPQPVDLALDLKEVQIRKRELQKEKDYVKKMLDSGYKSPAFEDLHKDVVAAQKTAAAKPAEKTETKK